MTTGVGTLAAVARRLALALAPLRAYVGDKDRFRGLMFRLGWETNDFPPAFAALGAAVNDAVTKAESLGDNPPATVVADLLASLSSAYGKLTSIAVAPADVPAGPFLAEINERLFELLFTDHLSAEVPNVFNLLRTLHVIDDVDLPAAPGRPARMRLALHFDRLRDALRAPGNLPSLVYGWGTPAFAVETLVADLAGFFHGLGFPVRITHRPVELLFYGEPESGEPILSIPFFVDTRFPVRRELSIDTEILPPDGSGIPGILLRPRIPPAFGPSTPLAPGISLRVRAGTASDTPAGVAIRTSGISIEPASSAGAGIGFGFDFTQPDPMVVLGSREGTRLEWQGASLDVNASVANGKTDLTVSAALNGLALVISGKGESLFDGFLEKIMGGGGSRVTIPMGIEWGGEHGIRFQGSGGFEVLVYPHLSLGPISIDAVSIRLQVLAGGPPDVRLDLGATIAGSLGPLDFLVEGIGLRADASFSKGNLGPLNLDLGFLPPTGVGLSLDVGGFKGGGFLRIDAAKGEYAGGLELDFQGIVTVRAIALLNTKFPDGHRGFSLVIIISAEFPPIQLGFGFTLVGVGGLLGLSRTLDTDAMREGMHQGALDSVLFPRNIVANAPRIINDLRQLFPPAEGHFLVGPMVKFGWGTPTILSLEFGLLLDIPRPAFVIIGRLRVGLPFQDLPLFDIRVTFVGGVDFEAGQFWFDATLYGSRLLAFSLTGDMAVRLYWKENANFILTVGGFHPAYTPPPMGLGTLQRLGITIFDGQPSLRAETYFAITSNTVQFGAKAELMFGIDIFNIYGFIAFDVLIQFDPFRFIATLSAMLAVRSGSATLMGIRIDALVEGPQPWHAKGTGHFEISIIISIEFDVDFEVSIGEERHDTLPAVDVLPKLAAAFAEPNNWRAVTPRGTNVQVTVRAFEAPSGTIILHPFGSLEITEKLVPLNLPIQKLGTERIGDGRVFGVEHVLLGSAPGQLAPLREQFAPAQFIEMTDAQKLSSHSFERYEAGVQVGGGDAVKTTYVKRRELAYEVIYIPEHRKRARFRLVQSIFDVFIGSGAVSQSPLSAAQNAPSVLGAQKATVAGEQFAVASTDDLTLHNDNMVFSSEAEARAAMRAAIDRDPTLTHSLQVIPSSLVRAA